MTSLRTFSLFFRILMQSFCSDLKLENFGYSFNNSTLLSNIQNFDTLIPLNFSTNFVYDSTCSDNFGVFIIPSDQY